MDLLFALAAVDEVTGGRQLRRLARGWMGWESRSGRWLRARVASVLVALADRLDPAGRLAGISGGRAAEPSRT